MRLTKNDENDRMGDPFLTYVHVDAPNTQIHQLKHQVPKMKYPEVDRRESFT